MATARRKILPFLATMIHHCKNWELTVDTAARYELAAEHVAFVTGSGEDTNKVQSIVADAEAAREDAAVEHGGDAFDGAQAGLTTPSEDAAGDDSGPDVDDEGEDDVEHEAAEDDDQQSGLSDFV